jgi:hypothetical protein
MFKKLDLEKTVKPDEKSNKTIKETLSEKGITLENLIHDLERMGNIDPRIKLTDKEKNLFIDVFYNQVHWTEAGKKHNVGIGEVFQMKNKFELIAKINGIDPNLIINLLK